MRVGAVSQLAAATTCGHVASVLKTLASGEPWLLHLAGSARVRNTRHDGVNIRALKPARG